jgi:hypothetical protein
MDTKVEWVGEVGWVGDVRKADSDSSQSRNILYPAHGTTFNAETAELAEQNRFFLRVPRVLR